MKIEGENEMGNVMKNEAIKQNAKINKNKNRVHLIDEIRGFAIICMVFYHALYDFLSIFEIDFPLFHSGIVDFIVTVFVFAFVSISGSACMYSHNNLKRGIICFLFGMVLTAVTYFILPSELIVFGILHMLGVSMMIYALLSKIINKINVGALIIVSLAIFCLTYALADGYLGFLSIRIFKLPDFLYETSFLFPLGFVNSTFHSSDYFALFPWLFAFFAGIGFGRLLKENKMPAFFYKMHLKPLAFIGRNTLIIYIVHQPIIYLIMTLIYNAVH